MSYVIIRMLASIFALLSLTLTVVSGVQQEVALPLQIIALKTEVDLSRVLNLLRSGGEFSDLAKQHSIHPSANNGGYWEQIADVHLARELRYRMGELPEGSIVHFFNPKLGYTIIRKLDLPSANKASIKHALARGTEYLKSNTIDQAIQEFKKALSLDPRCAEAHMFLGHAYRLLGAPELVGEAKAELQQALALDPNLIWARFDLARIYLDLGRAQKAKEELETVVKTRSGNPHFLSLLGEVNRQLGHLDLAVQQNRKALELNPSLTAAHYYLGLVYLDLKKEEEAIRELEIAARSEEVIPDICLALGSVYLEPDRLEKAIELFLKAIELDPSRAESHLKLAKAYRLKGLLDLALKQLHLASQNGNSFPDSPYFQQLQSEVFFEMGLIQQEKGLTSEAAEAYSRVLKVDPHHGKTHLHLAEILFMQGEYGSALEHALKAKNLGFAVDSVLFQKIVDKSNHPR